MIRLGDANTWHELLAEALAAHGIDPRGHPLPSTQEGALAAPRRSLALEALP